MPKKKPRRIILVDQDDTIADFEGELLSRLKLQHPGKMHIPLEHRTTFFAEDQYPEEYRKIFHDIYTREGFFRWLPPKKDSIHAIEAMRVRGHEVYICTAQLPDYENCILEKFEWVERNLGREWTKRIIIALDKTLVHGDYLIDDKPDVDEGISAPSWEHVVADMNYNRHLTGRKRITDWNRWAEVLELD